MHTSSLRRALANTFQIPLRPSLQRALQNGFPCVHRVVAPTSNSHRASFTTSAALFAKKKKGAKPDKRITMIRYFLHHPTRLMPRPLRFSRNRALRHWTIHRAWNLYRANLKASRQLELERQYNAMHAANEELRTGAGDGGKLFRKAQMKTGVWSIPERGGGIPIEYSRGMVEWVGTTGILGAPAKIWNHDWKRH